MTTNDFLAANFRDIHSYEDFFKSDRRDFLKRVGGGIFIFMAVNEALLGQQEAPVPRGGRGGRGGLPSDFNAFLRIGEDGRVTCFTGKIEMGQGPITSLPQEVAEELDTPLDTVDIVMGDTDLCPWDMGTFGSMTTRMFGPALRAAAAEARGVLAGTGRRGSSRFRRRNSSPRTASFPISRTRKIKSATASLRKDKKSSGILHAQAAAETTGAIQSHRQIAHAPRWRGQGHRQGALRGGHPRAGNALRENSPSARARRND